MGFITTGKAAEICGVGVNTIKNWIKNGHLQAIQLPGGHWRIPRGEFERFLEGMGLPGSNGCAGAPRVLVIDDDTHVHEFVREACELCCDAEVELAFAEDGLAGLIEIGRFRPQLLVLDIMMPGINGLELIQRIKADVARYGDIKILAMTGAQEKRLVMHRLRQAAPDAVLLKPVSVADFSATLSGLVECGGSEVAHGR